MAVLPGPKNPDTPPETYNSVFFTDPNIGYVVGSSGQILKTINAGITWTSLLSGTTNGLSSVYFVNDTTGYAVGTDILKTTNGGTTWDKQAIGQIFSLSSVYFSDVNIGYAVGLYGKILSTVDGGVDWTEQTSTTGSYLYSVFCTDTNTCYVVGEFGTILKKGGYPLFTNPEISTNNKLKIYPNPCHAYFTVNFNNPGKKPVQISISDVTGKLVRRIQTQQNQYKFNGEGLTPGIYFVNVKGDQVCNGKMVVR
jgi:Secretion system C-terminal sorting domain